MHRSARLLASMGLLAGLIFTNAWSQKLEIAIDGQRIKETVRHLASDQQMGRRTNSREFFQLQEWAARQFQRRQFQPAGENGTYFQAVPIPREYTISYGTPRLAIDGRPFHIRFNDFGIDPRSATGKTITGPVVFAGYGISAPDKGLDEYAGLDVRNKVVLVLKGDPGDFRPPRLLLSRRSPAAPPAALNLKREASDSAKIHNAYAHGASAILFYAPDIESPGRFSDRRRPQLQAPSFTRDFIIVTRISTSLFHHILWSDPQMSQRGFDTWLNGVRQDVQKNLTRSFTTARKAMIRGYDRTEFKGEKFHDATCRNVLAKMPGTDPALTNQVVVIGAHFDHVGVTDGQIYNGAEDNASGSAVILEIARLMAEYGLRGKRTIMLALWTGEELGLHGSRHWVEHPGDGISMDSVVAYFNMDMVGIGDSLNAPGALNFPELWEIIKRDQNSEVIGIVKPRSGGAGGSDHSAFIERGIEALALMSDAPGGHPDYHDSGDDAEKMDADILAKTCRFVLQGALNLARATDQALLIPERQALYEGLTWPLAVIDPGVGAERSWTTLKAGTPQELTALLKKTIAELRQPQGASRGERQMMSRYARSPLAIGLEGPAAFAHHLELLRIAVELLGVGRVDLDGTDARWFGGGISEAGAAALKAMEQEEIAVHLKNPSPSAVAALPGIIEKPVLISGVTIEEDTLITALKQKRVVVTVDFDPGQVARCVADLQAARSRFGCTESILLRVTSRENLERGRQALYMALRQQGWTKKEIYAIGGAGETRRSSGNLDRLPGRRPAYPGEGGGE